MNVLKPIHRAALLAASFAASVLVVLAVGAAFHEAARDPWLRDSPWARGEAARFAALADRAAQQHCVRRVVAAARARDAGAWHEALAAQPR